jgi:hypothetical protein
MQACASEETKFKSVNSRRRSERKYAYCGTFLGGEMTTGQAIEPANEIQSATLDETLKELTRIRNDHFVVKAVLQNLQAENELKTKLLDEALTELARWKIEALERRKIMIKSQADSIVRVPITGVIGK